MGTAENTNERDETADYIEQGMRRIVTETIDALTSRAIDPLSKPTSVELDFDAGTLTLTVADRAALVAWRRQILGPDLGDDVTVTSWCGWQTTVQVGRTPEEISAGLRAEWDRYTVPAIVPPPAGCPDPDGWEEQELRRVAIAALRAMATFLEDHPRLPAPTSIRMQSSHYRGDRAALVAIVEAAAEELGVDPGIHDDRASVSRPFVAEYGRAYEYTAYAALPEPTTAEVVSAALEG